MKTADKEKLKGYLRHIRKLDEEIQKTIAEMNEYFGEELRAWRPTNKPVFFDCGIEQVAECLEIGLIEKQSLTDESYYIHEATFEELALTTVLRNERLSSFLDKK
ncbi:MAG: hypothetical protein E7269_07755 [Lachnospiraceae bacterium]|nr:hypothetical protein [Lachnospiraceae bacterium]